MPYPLKHYHKLAAMMGDEKDIAIFRRFDDLNLLSLLSLQADIMELRQSFRRTAFLDDTHGQGSELMFSGNFKLSRENNSQQHSQLEDLRRKLNEYNELILQVSEMSRIKPPRKSQLRALKEWLRDAKNGFLQDDESGTWLDDDAAPYLCLNPGPDESDAFTRALQDFLVGPYHRLVGHRIGTGRVVDGETNSRSYDQGTVGRISGAVATVLSAMVPVLTIFVLNLVQSTEARIGLTALFTAIFALVLVRFSSAKKVEIFTATSTFAAVEVVFIGSAINPGSSATTASSNGTLTGR